MSRKTIGARAKRVAKNVEEKVMAAEGRRSIRQRVDTVKKVSTKALKAGAVAGMAVAAAVVMRERKKRK